MLRSNRLREFGLEEETFHVSAIPETSNCHICTIARRPFYNFDRMVYSLYGHTREEVAMIEDSLKEKAGSAEGAGDAAVEKED